MRQRMEPERHRAPLRAHPPRIRGGSPTPRRPAGPAPILARDGVEWACLVPEGRVVRSHSCCQRPEWVLAWAGHPMGWWERGCLPGHLLPASCVTAGGSLASLCFRGPTLVERVTTHLVGRGS